MILDTRYVEMSDGVKLCANIFRPNTMANAIPAVLKAERYGRAFITADGEPIDTMSDIDPVELDVKSYYRGLVAAGYAVVVFDVRGCGASFGVYEALLSDRETQDTTEMIAWLAAQEWCDGNIGMTGASYGGITQLLAAGQTPPALKALFPRVASFDAYRVIFNGGVFRSGMFDTWGGHVARLNTEAKDAPKRVAPAPEDEDGAMLNAAFEERSSGPGFQEFVEALGRNKLGARDFDYQRPMNGSPSDGIEAINKAGTPICHYAGWTDLFVDHSCLAFVNSPTPSRLIIGPWGHRPRPEHDFGRNYDEAKRWLIGASLSWFDEHLKGVDRGQSGARVDFAMMDGVHNWTWRQSDQWPPRESAYARWSFAAGPTGTIASANDGLLTTDALTDDTQHSMTEATDCATGLANRTVTANGGPFFNEAWPEMSALDAKGLTFTSPPLQEDLLLVGHPVVQFFAQSTAKDADFVVWLEAVDARGRSRNLTEGILRASHRTLGEPPYNNLDLPWHSSARADIEAAAPLNNGDVVPLRLALLPIGQRLRAGHRLRVTIVNSDTDQYKTLKNAPDTRITLKSGPNQPSFIDLPVYRG